MPEREFEELMSDFSLLDNERLREFLDSGIKGLLRVYHITHIAHETKI